MAESVSGPSVEAVSTDATSDHLERLPTDCTQSPPRPDGKPAPPGHATLAYSLAPAVEADPETLTVLGQYQVLSEIGRGGMGVVFKARHRQLDRLVALKVARVGQLSSAGDVQRFHAEAQAVAKLDHPNIVPIYDVGESNGLHYFSMALVEGQSLAQRVGVGPLPPREAAQFMRQVADAMAYAHANGVIHRDLKPGNILIDAASQPRVTDFGLAKRADADSSLPQAGQVVGTPSYMPPEQAVGTTENVGPAADTYALGATLYCLLTGRPPFQAASVMETLRQVTEQEPLPPRRLNPAVDLDLDTICLKCLEKQPERRYESARSLADDLQCFLDDRPIHARRAGELEKMRRWCRRNPVIAASLAAAVAIFAAAFVLVSWSYYGAEAARGNEANQRHAADNARDDAERKEKAERWERYRANLAAASSSLQMHSVEAVRRHLAAAPIEHRNWEWRHLAAKLDTTRSILHSQENVLWLFPQARGELQFQATPRDGMVRLLDPARGLEQSVLQTNCRNLTTFVPSPTGTHVAYVDDEANFRLWDVIANTENATWKLARNATVQFSPDGARLLTRTADGNLSLFDLAARREVLALNGAGHVTFSGHGRRLACAMGPGTIRVYDAIGGMQLAELRVEDPNGIHVFTLNQDGSRLATGGDYPDNAVRVWDVATGKVEAVGRAHRNAITGLDFAPDDTRIGSCSLDQTVRLWEAADLRPITVIRGHNGPVHRVLFSPDGSRLISASSFDLTVRLWDTASGEPVTTLMGHKDAPVRLACSRDGTALVSGGLEGGGRFWDLQHLEREVLRGHSSYVYDVAVSGDGKSVASAAWDGTARIWDLASGAQIGLLEHDEKIVGGVAFSPDGMLLATTPRNHTVCVWDAVQGKRLHVLPTRSGFLTDLRPSFNRQGTLLAVGGGDGMVRLWNPRTGKPAGELSNDHNWFIADVAFNPDGTLLAAAGVGALQIWDVANRRLVADLREQPDVIEGVEFSSDGMLLATCGHDKTARVWDAHTFKHLATLAHGSRVYGVAFSPDSTRLATACADNTIRLWDVITGQEVAELRGHAAYVHAIAFTPDGTRLVSGSGDFTVRVWDTLSAEERGRHN